MPGKVAASSIAIFAPAVEISCTTHWRAAKPPSSVIHADRPNSLRASRFLSAGIFIPPKHQAYCGSALETVDLNKELLFRAGTKKHCRVAQTPLYVRPLRLAGRICDLLRCGQVLVARY